MTRIPSAAIPKAERAAALTAATPPHVTGAASATGAGAAAVKTPTPPAAATAATPPATGTRSAAASRRTLAPASLAPASAMVPSGTSQAIAGAANDFRTPEWVKDAIFYQVFPERFANGDMGNDPQGTVPWGSKPTNDGFMGGDLLGVTQKMGYLTTLGVNALYLNPIFTSPSNHKYNITDYEHVDPAFGGDQAFRGLVDSAHRNGVKVMLDGVFNHTSHQHGWFQDVRNRGPKSEHFDKFDVLNWPIKYRLDEENVLRSDDYKSWWGYATLPELRTTNPKIRDYFLHDRNSVVKKWLRDGKVDGWRMDVADEVEADFWKEARKEIKATNPDAYIAAENWHDASAYLQGDQFDGAMNYKYFQQPAVNFFAKKQINADQFVQSLQNNYPREARYAMMNMLASHDTPRFRTEAGGDWYRQRPAAIFQMTYVGAPVIYYGEEIGMEGAKDPDSRRAFPWEKVPTSSTRPNGVGTVNLPTLAPSASGDTAPQVSAEHQIFDLYRKLIDLRKQLPALRRGEFEVLATHNADSTIAYRRAVSGEARDVLVALNNDITHHGVKIPVGSFAPDGTVYVDNLSGARHAVRDGHVTIPQVEGNYGAVLVRDTASSAATAKHA